MFKRRNKSDSKVDAAATPAGKGAKSIRFEQNLKALEKAIVDRTDLRVKLETRQAAVHKQHASITDKITPLVDDSYFEVVSAAEDVGKVGNKTVRSFINGGLQRMQAALDAGGEMNIVTGLLAAAALTSSPQVLAMLEDRYTTAATRAQKEACRGARDRRAATADFGIAAARRLQVAAGGRRRRDRTAEQDLPRP